MSSSEFVSPDALLDLEFYSPWLDASLRLGAPVSWEMSLGDEHRNRTLPLQLGHFSWLSFITTGLWLPANHPLNGAHTFAIFFVKPPFSPDFISQLSHILYFLYKKITVGRRADGPPRVDPVRRVVAVPRVDGHVLGRGGQAADGDAISLRDLQNFIFFVFSINENIFLSTLMSLSEVIPQPATIRRSDP